VKWSWLLLLAACRQDMHDQPKYEALEASQFFADGRSVRPQVEGTVARGELRLDEHLYAGLVNGSPAETFPFPISQADLERGRERYDIYCSPCHGETGDGLGMVVQRGFPRPPSFHEERIVTMPPGHYVDVITRGLGRMFPYADRVKPHDRWRIAAYLRALQRSRKGTIEDVPRRIRAQLESSP
jgi:mono/diheme cytochrome c family protein